MDILIENFLPMYQDIGDPNFTISNKKEFYEEQLDRVEPVPLKKGILMKHQKIIARFLSSYTLYDSILLVHEMGSGKSCSAIGAIEQIQHENIGSFTGALILGKGEGILDNFKNELIFQCTAGQYIPDDWKSLSKKALAQRKRKQIEHYYSFNTFEKLAKELKKFENNEEYIILRYSNKIIVIDEVHNLRIRKTEKESADIYNQIFKFLHIIKNCKIILMSGTPMKDTPEEIVSIMNLILPLNKQLPNEIEFKAEYMENNLIKENKKLQLKAFFKGRVSYLLSMKSNIVKEYIGRYNVENLQHFIIKQDIMSSFQSLHYSDAYNLDTSSQEKQSGIFSQSSQSILFVYPDGSYGEKGQTKYMNKTDNKSKNSDLVLNQLFLKNFNRIQVSDYNGRLRKLEEYSSKFASTISSILNAENKSCFVYCKLVAGSGAILFSKILEQVFGFTKATGNETKNGKRYAIITGDNNSNTHLRNIIDRFNLPDNMNGNIIKVLIGSTVISEGFSLKNVQEIHVLTPHWNYSDTSQAIARGIRLGSHKDLINAGIIPIVKIYQHASTTEDGTLSLDIHKYKVSENKDISIKSIERLLKESAIDCSLNYERNKQSIQSEDGSRECDYMNCDYVCDKEELEEIDNLTYQLYYNSDSINNLILKIIELFRIKFIYSLSTIENKFNNEYSSFEIITALQQIINESIEIYNKYGYISYLKEQNNLYFLINSLTNTGYFLNEYYCENPIIIKDKNTFINLLNSLMTEMLPSTIEKFFSITTENQISVLLEFIQIEIQELILEYCLIAKSKNKVENKNSREMIITYFSKYISIINNTYTSSLLFKKLNILRCNTDLENSNWIICSPTILDAYINKDKEILNRLENDPRKIYALIDGDKFRIRDIEKEEKTQQEKAAKKGGVRKEGTKKTHTGLVCGSGLKKDALYDLVVNRLKISDIYENNESKNDNCSNKSPIIGSIYTIYGERPTQDLYLYYEGKKSTNILFSETFNTDESVRSNRLKLYNKKIQEQDELKFRQLLCRSLYWCDKKVEFICKSLKEWFKYNDLCMDGSMGNKK